MAGLGVGFLPKALARPFVDKGLLVEKTIAKTEVNTRYFMAWRRGKKGKALRWLIEELKTFSKQQGNDIGKGQRTKLSGRKEPTPERIESELQKI